MPNGGPPMQEERGTMTPSSGGRAGQRSWGSWDGKMVDKNYNGPTTSKFFGSTVSPQGELVYPKHEKPKDYAPGGKEREELIKELEKQRGSYQKVPIMAGRVETYNEESKVNIKNPGNHRQILGEVHLAGDEDFEHALQDFRGLEPGLLRVNYENNAALFNRLAWLMSGRYRCELVACMMLTQGLTVNDAEQDLCRVIDQFRIAAYNVLKVRNEKLPGSGDAINYQTRRQLEGFVAVISANGLFSSCIEQIIDCFATCTPMIWKLPSGIAPIAWRFMEICMSSGVGGDGRIQFLPCRHEDFMDKIMKEPELTGVNFMGTTENYYKVAEFVADNLDCYETIPKMAASTSVNNYSFSHYCINSWPEPFVAAMLKGAYSYSGQAPFTAHQCYFRSNGWIEPRKALIKYLGKITYGDVTDFSVFCGPMMNEEFYKSAVKAIEFAEQDSTCEIIYGGEYSDENGWYVAPTVITTTSWDCKLLNEEFFGPIAVITLYEQVNSMCDVINVRKLQHIGCAYGTSRKFMHAIVQDLFYGTPTLILNGPVTDCTPGERPACSAGQSGTAVLQSSTQSIRSWSCNHVISNALDCEFLEVRA